MILGLVLTKYQVSDMKSILFGILIPDSPVQDYYSIALSIGRIKNSNQYSYSNVINIPISSVVDIIKKNL
jgi:hypothetical protein